MPLDDDDSESDQFNRQRFDAQKALLIQAYEKIHKTLDELNDTQDRLIDTGKFAILGETLTGVAHEIRAPLNAIISSQQSIDHSLQSLYKTALDVGRDSSDNERAELEAFVGSLPKSDILANLQKSAELKSTYQESLAERGFDEGQSQKIATLMSGLPINSVEQVSPILDHKNPHNALSFARDYVRINTASWIAESSTIKAKKLLESLRDYTYKNNGSIEKVCLKESVETILTIYQSDLMDIEIVKDYQPVGKVEVDPDRISQVWSNLLLNALHASNHRGKFELNIYPEGDFSVFSIKDYAGGIPKEVRDQVFEPFFTTKPKGEGTGLGLSIIKKIVEDHNGEISLESEEGIGTTVIVKLKSTSNENSV